MARAQPTSVGAATTREPGARVVKYVAIRNHLLGQILSGALAPGAQLPSEHEIMALFGVSRVTTRQALDMLRSEGRVEARRGKGYFVRAMPATAELARLQSFGEMMAPLGVPLLADVIEISEVIPPVEIAGALGLQDIEPAIRLVRARIAAGATVSVDESFFPLPLGRRLIQLDLVHRDVFELMETRLGVALSYADIALGMAPPPPDFARLIGLKTDEPAFTLTRTARDVEGRAVMVQASYARPGLLRFHIRATR
ncbi:MAG: GntR family transcriptional regulator [Proteobacteria bacterium]|nr:GntR family transcriptional regulator [Pseudomonadota bacterium]